MLLKPKIIIVVAIK